jgi:hypothetical protein
VKEQYLKLREEGKSYAQIAELTNKAVSTVYAAISGKTSHKVRFQKFREQRLSRFKSAVGACCSICGYQRCQSALEFHHKDPNNKSFEISDAIYQKIKLTDEQIFSELKKCILICANCHRELHEGLITV